MNDEYPYYNLIYKLNKKHIKEIIKNFKPNIITTKFLDAKKYNKKYFIIIDKWDATSNIKLDISL